jgi:hypothetical protein
VRPVGGSLAAEARVVRPQEVAVLSQQAPAAVVQLVVNTVKAIRVLHTEALESQLLILLYSAVDTLAWLEAPNADVTRKDFIAWADRYLLRQSSLECTAEDLYGARCGLLHTHGPDSGRARSGLARQIWYYTKERSHDFLLRQIGTRTDIVPGQVPNPV